MTDLNKLAEELMELANSRQLEMEGSAVLAEAAALLRAAAGADVQGLMDLANEYASQVARISRNESGAMNDALNASELLESALRLALSVWRPIEDAPKDGTEVLALIPQTGLPAAVYFTSGKWAYATSGAWAGFPTHYMPLPPQPKGQL